MHKNALVDTDVPFLLWIYYADKICYDQTYCTKNELPVKSARWFVHVKLVMILHSGEDLCKNLGFIYSLKIGRIMKLYLLSIYGSIVSSNLTFCDICILMNH